MGTSGSHMEAEVRHDDLPAGIAETDTTKQIEGTTEPATDAASETKAEEKTQPAEIATIEEKPSLIQRIFRRKKYNVPAIIKAAETLKIEHGLTVEETSKAKIDEVVKKVKAATKQILDDLKKQ